VWFHIGVDEMATSAPDTLFRVAFDVDDTHGFAIYVHATDAGAQPGGLFVTTPASEVPLEKQPSVSIRCRSVLLGVQKADLTGVPAGAILHNVRVTSSIDTDPLLMVGGPSASSIHDAAPDVGGVDYTLGSAL
jgi:hypothetical protein